MKFYTETIQLLRAIAPELKSDKGASSLYRVWKQLAIIVSKYGGRIPFYYYESHPDKLDAIYLYYRDEMQKLGYGEKLETKTQFRKYADSLLKHNLVREIKAGIFIKDPLNFFFDSIVSGALDPENSNQILENFKPTLHHTFTVKDVSKVQANGIKVPVVHIDINPQQIFTESPTFFFEKLLQALTISKFHYHHVKELRYNKIAAKIENGQKVSKKDQAFYNKNAAPLLKPTTPSDEVFGDVRNGRQCAQVVINGIRETRSKSRYAKKKSVASGILRTFIQKKVVPVEQLDNYSFLTWPFQKAYEKVGVLQAASIWEVASYKIGFIKAKDSYRLSPEAQQAKLSSFGRKNPDLSKEIATFFVKHNSDSEKDDLEKALSNIEILEAQVESEPTQVEAPKVTSRFKLDLEALSKRMIETEIAKEKAQLAKKKKNQKEERQNALSEIYNNLVKTQKLSDSKIVHELGRLTEFGIYDLFPDFYLDDMDFRFMGAKYIVDYLREDFDKAARRVRHEFIPRIKRKLNDSPTRKGPRYTDSTSPFYRRKGEEKVVVYDKTGRSKKGDHFKAFQLIQDVVRKNLPAQLLEDIEDPQYLSYLIKESMYSPRIYPLLFFACEDPESLLDQFPKYDLTIWQINSLRMIDHLIYDVVANLDGNRRIKPYKGSSETYKVPGYLDISYGIFRYVYGNKFSDLENSPSGLIRSFDIPYISYAERLKMSDCNGLTGYFNMNVDSEHDLQTKELGREAAQGFEMGDCPPF